MMNGHSDRSVDIKLITLSNLNFRLFVAWYRLRISHEAGDDYPLITLGLTVLTVWTWSQLLLVIFGRFKTMTKPPAGGGLGPG
jgi:hypothetical protein